MFQIVLPQVTLQDAPSPSAWLDVVWSLVVLGRATPQHIASVLNPDFCDKLDVSAGMQRPWYEVDLYTCLVSGLFMAWEVFYEFCFESSI
jgi:hypothetical protein